MMTGSGSIQRYRRAAGAAQALLFVGLPFLTVGGESALRFDVGTLTLHVFGAAVGVDELFVTLPALIFLTLLLLLVTVSFGRVWCGWSCPQTVLGDLTRLVQPWPGRVPRPWRRAAGVALTALVSLLVGAATVWYFVPPGRFLADLAAGRLGPVAAGAWAVLSLVLFLDLTLVRGRFCATACPYARLQGVLYDAHTLTIAYDQRRDPDCVDCGACVRCCPTGIDIRDGAQMECIACAECVDACRPIMLKLKRKPDLVGYFFGEPGRARRLLRPATVGLLAGHAALPRRHRGGGPRRGRDRARPHRGPRQRLRAAPDPRRPRPDRLRGVAGEPLGLGRHRPADPGHPRAGGLAAATRAGAGRR